MSEDLLLLFGISETTVGVIQELGDLNPDKIASRYQLTRERWTIGWLYSEIHNNFVQMVLSEKTIDSDVTSENSLADSKDEKGRGNSNGRA